MDSVDLAEPTRPVVFLSYAHDSDDHKAAVCTLATVLRTCGIDVKFDLWHEDRRQDWYEWMLKWIKAADFVIVVASPRYRDVGDGDAPPDRHRGVQAEAAQIRELLYRDRAAGVSRLLPVVLPGRSLDELPDFAQPYTASHFAVDPIAVEGVELLLRVMTGQPRNVPPDLGEIPILPPLVVAEPSQRREGLKNALTKTVDRHRRRTANSRPAIMADYPGAAVLVERLTSAEAAQIHVVHGRAGAGKSNVVAEALRLLESADWTAGVVRMDAIRQDSVSAAELGSVMDLPDSPVAVLARATSERRRVLVVDQLDAVSTYSGRIPDSYDAITEILEQAEKDPVLKIVLVVRTVDLESDPRMRYLLSDAKRVSRFEVGALAPEAVRSALVRGGVDPAGLTPVTLELLRVPLHLAVFSRLSADSQRLQYRTLADLYEQFTKHLQQHLERDLGCSELHRIVTALVDYMSRHESLQAPTAVLDDATRSQVGALVSLGLLLEDATSVSFFHETYFDFHFARTFVAQGRDLHEFLVDSGQQLFRRAQTRQVLEYLAGFDRRAFRETVVRLLTSDSVRSHLLDLVIGVLRSLPDPGADDWVALEPIAFGGFRRSRSVANLLSQPAWFDAADEVGRLVVLIGNQKASIADELVYAARERPHRVAELIRPYIGTSPEWNHRLRAMIQWSLRPGLVDLAVELMERGILDDVRGPIAVNSDFWSVLYPIKESDPVGAARIIGAYLRRTLAEVQAQGGTDPFETGHLTDLSSSGGGSLIGEVAAAAPEQFILEVLPFVIEVTAGAGVLDQSGLMVIPRWSYRFPETTSRSVGRALFAGLEDALTASASEILAGGRDLISALANSEAEPLRFLACRTYTAAADQCSDEAIDWLLSDRRNLRLGWISSPRWATRELIAVSAQYCGDDRIDSLCAVLLDYYPKSEMTIEGRRVRGFGQYELLSAIPAARRSAKCARRVGELERKFANSPPAPPTPVEFGVVGSPVPETAREFMTDEDWLRAIAKYRSDRHEHRRDFTKGGAWELAQLLGRQARSDPERFARLALTFDAQTPAAHFGQVISGVAGHIPVELLARLCRHARNMAGSAVGRDICRAVDAVTSQITADLVELLVHYTDDPDPDQEFARTTDSNGRTYFGGDLFAAGLNCTRGAAAAAIGRALCHRPELADELLPTVARLVRDPIMAVRVQASIPVSALLNTHVDAALDLADELFGESPVDVCGTSPVTQLLIYAILRAPHRFAVHLTRALGGPEDVVELAGQVWAVATLNDCLDDSVVGDLAALPVAARRGVAQVAAATPDRGIDLLSALLNDDDAAVRDKAAQFIYQLDEAETTTVHALVTAFTANATSVDNFGVLFRSLESTVQLLPDAVLDACDKVIELAGTDLGDMRTSAVAISSEMAAVVLRVYRQGNAAIRTRCLDLIDTLADLGSFGLEKMLASER